VAAARDEAGLEKATELGADATVSLAGERGPGELAQAFREAAGGDVHVIVDPLWGEPAVAAAEAAAPFARLVNLGQSASVDARLTSAAVRSRCLSLLGLFLGHVPQDARAAAHRRMLEHAEAGRLRVDHEVLPLERIGEAWERQAASPHGKLVLRPGAPST
jgi:NADPH:quinone reductase-like Zn-dependent oxidoreductase